MTISDNESLAIQPVEIIGGSVGLTGPLSIGPIGITGAIGLTGVVGVTNSAFVAATTLTGSSSALGSDIIAATNVSGYRSIFIQFIATVGTTANAAFALQESNDGLTGWKAASLVDSNFPQFTGPAINWIAGAMAQDSIVRGAINAKFIRIRITSNAGTGSCAITAFLSTTPTTEVPTALQPVMLVDNLGNSVNGNQAIAMADSSGTAITLGQKLMSASWPVTFASDQPRIGITGFVGITGTGIGVTFAQLGSQGITGLIGITGFPIVGITGAPAISITGLIGITGIQGVTFQAIGFGVTFPPLMIGLTGVQSFSLGSTLGKTIQMLTGSITTSATTADQAILTFARTSGKVFYLQYLTMKARIAAIAATATSFGNASFEAPSGTKLITEGLAKDGGNDALTLFFGEPIPITGATLRVVCTPASGSTFVWTANFGGYEK